MGVLLGDGMQLFATTKPALIVFTEHQDGCLQTRNQLECLIVEKGRVT